jgi:hypothetical protein
MAYKKYSEEQLRARRAAGWAVDAARAHLKTLREAKKSQKEGVTQLRRELKSEIRSRKEAKLAYGRLMATLRKVYKPYLVARRKVARLEKAKVKAAEAAVRKARVIELRARIAKQNAELESLELEYAASPAAREADKAYAADEVWDETDGEVFCQLNYNGELNIDKPALLVRPNVPPFAFLNTTPSSPPPLARPLLRRSPRLNIPICA